MTLTTYSLLLVRSQRERAEPGALLTSSTESFRSGLTGYAQLQASRATSPQKAVKVGLSCCISSQVALQMPK